MQASFTHPAQSAHPSAGPDDHPHDARLRGLTRQQLEDRLAWLSWHNVSAFTAVMDYMDFVETLAADTGLTESETSGSHRDEQEPAPVCGRCGGDLGIFLRFGLDWRHYADLPVMPSAA